jgi:hypothetical protein
MKVSQVQHWDYAWRLVIWASRHEAVIQKLRVNIAPSLDRWTECLELVLNVRKVLSGFRLWWYWYWDPMLSYDRLESGLRSSSLAWPPLLSHQRISILIWYAALWPVVILRLRSHVWSHIFCDTFGRFDIRKQWLQLVFKERHPRSEVVSCHVHPIFTPQRQ